MDKTEALAIAECILAELRSETYESLVRRIDRPETRVLRADSGVEYQAEVTVFWDGGKRNDARVIVGVDDGGFRAVMPLTRDFIVAPDGSFVGEE
jgi:hypothetical protein